MLSALHESTRGQFAAELVVIRLYRRPMMAARSRFDAPSASSDLMRRSSETVGSPASIFATRDWLDFSEAASATCVMPRDVRRSLSPSASFSRSSMYASSSSVRPRKSLTVPKTHPFFCSFFRLLSFILVVTAVPLEALFAHLNQTFRRLLGLLGKDRENQNGISVNAVNHSPICLGIVDPQFMAARPNRRHGLRFWHSKRLSLLEAAQQKPDLHSCDWGKRRSLDLRA